METSNPCASEYDDEGRALGHLLDAFGSLFTLRQIASAYTKAGHNVDLAGQILFELEGSTHTSDAELRDTKVVEMSSNDISEKPTRTDKSPKASKPKRYSVSMGTVSSVIGKGYVGPSQVQVQSCEAIKPLKLDSKELPMADLWGEELSSDFTVKNDAMHKDVEDFLFKMLGDGFQLDMSVIREVLGCCGYDVKKSMERLLDLSESALDKSDDVVGDSSSKIAGKCPESESLLSRENSQHMSLAQSDGARVLNRNGKKSPTWHKERYDLQKEVLAALFNVPERTEEVPRTRPVKAVRRTRAVGHTVVVEPPSDTTTEHSTAIVESKQDIEDDGDDSYQVLRRATMEHWATMKEYYKAAVDAFAKGDRTRADELLQQGQFFNNKAREADEKSAQKILECRNNETQDEMCLDLHAHDSKEAIRLLKFHLTSISGIPSIQYLKVIMETNADDITKGAQKRLRQVRKLLEKESIKWTEEGDGGTILIRVDEVNPKRLSFAKKPQ